MASTHTFAPAHLACVGGRVKNKIGGRRVFTGPETVEDSTGQQWTVTGDAPRFSGACPLCSGRVEAARHWEAVLLSHT